MIKKPKLCWNVYYENSSKKKITTLNIFDHYRFVKDCAKELKKAKDDREAGERIFKSNLMYFFWSKCEYEIVLTPWVNPRGVDDYDRKIDVYEQVMNNWHVFIEYAWAHRKDVIKLARYNEEYVKQLRQQYAKEKEERNANAKSEG